MLGFEFSRNQRLALYALIGLSLIALSYAHTRNTFGGGSSEVVLREPGQAGSRRVIATDSDPLPGASGSRAARRVMCHVVGCVNTPGLYALADGDRIADAIAAAGGAKPNADLNAINLAARVEDGSQVHLPSIEETRPGQARSYGSTAPVSAHSSAESTGKAPGNKLRNPGDGVVHINSASIEDLQRLPGVGPATAQKIIDYRAHVGTFAKPEQLIDVKGIGPKTFEKMRPFVAL